MSVVVTDRPLRPLEGAPQIGSRIREARQALGLTQDALARSVGVSRSAVAQWETDRTGQVRANLTRVASVLGVSVGFLLHGEADQWSGSAESADEWAILRLYRGLREGERQELMRMVRKMAGSREGLLS